MLNLTIYISTDIFKSYPTLHLLKPYSRCIHHSNVIHFEMRIFCISLAFIIIIQMKCTFNYILSQIIYSILLANVILQEFKPLHLYFSIFYISGWNDFANSIMNKWFSFYYTYYEDRKRSGIASDPIDNEYDSSESISVIPSKHFYYT